MELMTKLVVNPLLWIVYITLPYLSVTCPALPHPVAPSSWRILVVHFIVMMYPSFTVATRHTSTIPPPPFYEILPTTLYITGTFLAVMYFLQTLLLVLFLGLEPSSDSENTRWIARLQGYILRWGGYIVGLVIFAWAKATKHLFIFGLKNRRACQFLSTLAAMVIALTKANIFAAIPVSFGILLTLPDFDPDPWMEFKVRFAEFLTTNMDQEFLQTLLYSRFFKMLSCNEMMPSLPRHFQSSEGAWFRCDWRTSQHNISYDSIVEPEYKIGLGSITTSVRKGQIHVLVVTPFSGVKSMTIKNTPLSRYNLNKSAQFWRQNPQMGIWNEAERLAITPVAQQIYCVSVDEWIRLCGSVYHIFEEVVSKPV